MGTNNLGTQTDGTTIDADDVNQFKTALTVDHVPRNSTGVATDLAGDLGTSALRWNNSYVKKSFIGDAGDLNAITDNGALMSFEVGGSEVFTLSSSGLERGQLPAVGQQISASCGTATTTSASYVDITNLSVTITTTGRPVILMLIASGPGVGGTNWGSLTSSANTCDYNLQFLRGATSLGEYRAKGKEDQGFILPGPFIDPVSSGTYTYKCQYKRTVGTNALGVYNAKLVAYEL